MSVQPPKIHSTTLATCVEPFVAKRSMTGEPQRITIEKESRKMPIRKRLEMRRRIRVEILLRRHEDWHHYYAPSMKNEEYVNVQEGKRDSSTLLPDS